MMTLEELSNDYDWANVFGEGDSSSDCSNEVDAIGNCPADPIPTRADVIKILAIRNGENDGDSWIGVFLLRDGRYLYATGWCDYSGWG